MRYLDIDVLVHNDSTKLMDSLEMDFDLETCDIKTIRIYKISFIMPYEQNGINYTQIFINGNSFISPLDYNTFKKLVTVFG